MSKDSLLFSVWRQCDGKCLELRRIDVRLASHLLAFSKHVLSTGRRIDVSRYQARLGTSWIEAEANQVGSETEIADCIEHRTLSNQFSTVRPVDENVPWLEDQFVAVALQKVKIFEVAQIETTVWGGPRS